jgi:predicted O-methyltransferase YrrM
MRQQLLQKLYQGKDPFEGYKMDAGRVTNHGWNSTHRFLTDSILELNPEIILEFGVWMGGSTIHMARFLKQSARKTQVLACDTFLACDILRTVQETLPMLRMEFGRPTYWENFYSNVLAHGVTEQVIPLHLDSRSGLRWLKRLGITVDMIHHDATHYAPDVLEDLVLCWDVLRPGGHLIIDDYIKSDLAWPAVMNFNGLVSDVDYFCRDKEVTLEVDGVKCRIVKPNHS